MGETDIRGVGEDIFKEKRTSGDEKPTSGKLSEKQKNTEKSKDFKSQNPPNALPKSGFGVAVIKGCQKTPEKNHRREKMQKQLRAGEEQKQNKRNL